MKTTKYYFLYLLLAAVCTMGFTSCGGDDDDDEWGGDSTELQSKLQGTWEIYQGIVNVMGQSVTIDRATFYQYKPDNAEFWDDVLRFNGSTVNGVRYSLNGTQLLIEGMSLYDDFTIHVRSVNETSLVLREEAKIEGMTFTCDLEYRKK